MLSCIRFHLLRVLQRLLNGLHNILGVVQIEFFPSQFLRHNKLLVTLLEKLIIKLFHWKGMCIFHRIRGFADCMQGQRLIPARNRKKKNMPAKISVCWERKWGIGGESWLEHRLRVVRRRLQHSFGPVKAAFSDPFKSAICGGSSCNEGLCWCVRARVLSHVRRCRHWTMQCNSGVRKGGQTLNLPVAIATLPLSRLCESEMRNSIARVLGRQERDGCLKSSFQYSKSTDNLWNQMSDQVY